MAQPIEITMVEGQVLKIEPDDVVVITAAAPLSHDIHHAIVGYVRSVVGADTKVLVIDAGLKLSLLRGLPADSLPETL